MKIYAVGDICPGDKLVAGRGIFSLTKKYGNSYPFNFIKSRISDGDFGICNLEGLLTTKVNINNVQSFPFCGQPEFAQELKRNGFSVVNMANNHVLEHGVDMFEETVAYLVAAGINVCGLRDPSEEYYSKPVILEKDRLKVGIIGYNWVGKDKFKDVDKYIAQSHDSIVNYTWNREEKYKLSRDFNKYANANVLADLKKLKSATTFVVLIAHWGYEFVHFPPQGVVVEAHEFVNSGADLILGIHPHVIQGFETVDNSIIYYSLGNFIFDMVYKASKYSVLLECYLSGDKDFSTKLIPIKINKNFQPMIASNKDEKKVNYIINCSNEKILSKEIKKILKDDLMYFKYEKKYNWLKIISILYHFKLIFIHPSVFKTILHKGINFILFLFKRLSGRKIRW